MITVIFVALGGVGQDFIGFYNLSKLLDRGVGSVVGVVLFYEEKVPRFDFFLCRGAGEIEDIVWRWVGMDWPWDMG